MIFHSFSKISLGSSKSITILQAVIIDLLFLGNWCESNIGDHDKDSDSLALSETVESADDTDAYADPSSYEAPGGQEGDSSSDNESEDSGKSENVTGSAIQQKALNYLIKIKEDNRIPQRTVENIAFATSRLFQGALLNLRRNLAQTLQNADVILEDIPGATDCFDELSDCFDGLEKGWLPSDEKLPCVVGLDVTRSFCFSAVLHVCVLYSSLMLSVSIQGVKRKCTWKEMCYCKA